MEVALNEPAAVRIIGNLMGNYINAKAVIRGTITKIEPDGKKGTMKTTDEEFIQLLFEKQGNNAIPGSLIEAVGQVMSRNQFRVVNFVQFPAEALANFDNDLHKQIIETLIKYEHLFNVVPVSENDEPVLKNLNNDFAFVWDN